MSVMKAFSLACLGGISAILGFALAADTYTFGQRTMSRSNKDKLGTGLLVLGTSTLGGLVAGILFGISYKCVERADLIINTD